VEKESIAIPTQVRWLANCLTIRERRRKGDMAASSIIFGVKKSKTEQSLVKKGIEVAGEWYQIEMYTNMRPYSRCELCCGWGHIEIECGRKH